MQNSSTERKDVGLNLLAVELASRDGEKLSWCQFVVEIAISFARVLCTMTLWMTPTYKQKQHICYFRNSAIEAALI